MKERLKGQPGRRAPGRPAGASGDGARPTIKAVAAAAGVSTATVSQAVNGTGRISEGTRRRVLAAAAELGWSPSASATALRRARTRTIALVVRRPTDVLGADPHFSELITGLEGQLAPEATVCCCTWSPTWPRRARCTNGSSPRAGSTAPC